MLRISDCIPLYLIQRLNLYQVFDIIRLLTADDSLLHFENDGKISLLLHQCSKLILQAKLLLKSSITLTVETPSAKYPTSRRSFYSDEIGVDLYIVLVTLHLAVLNQSLKYESLISLSDPNLNLSERRLSDVVAEIRGIVVHLSESLIAMITSAGAAYVLSQLAHNDKELILSLLDVSEIELRLERNVALALPNRASSDVLFDSQNVSVDFTHSINDNFYIQCEDILGELCDVSFGAISSFLLLISECIAFDASLFCDFLCSPETAALKYLLRISKYLLALKPAIATATVSGTAITKFKNTLLFDICVKTISAIKSDRSTSSSSDSAVSKGNDEVKCPHNGAQESQVDQSTKNSVETLSGILPVFAVSWVASEKMTSIDGDEQNSDKVNQFTDESLWGKEMDIPRQRVCPQEWLRGEERTKRIKHGTNPLSIALSTDDKNGRILCTVMTERAEFLYSKTAAFLIDLRDLLVRLGSPSERSVTVPFDSALLVRRLSAIIDTL